MVYEIGEVISLIIVLSGYAIIIKEYVHHRNILHIFIAYTALLIGIFATVLEGFYFPEILNILEHSIGNMLAGALFGLTAYLAYKKILYVEKKIAKKIKAIK